MARDDVTHTPSEFSLLRARHEGRSLIADGGLDLPEIARQLGNLLHEDRLRRVGGDLLQQATALRFPLPSHVTQSGFGSTRLVQVIRRCILPPADRWSFITHLRLLQLTIPATPSEGGHQPTATQCAPPSAYSVTQLEGRRTDLDTLPPTTRHAYSYKHRTQYSRE